MQQRPENDILDQHPGQKVCLSYFSGKASYKLPSMPLLRFCKVFTKGNQVFKKGNNLLELLEPENESRALVHTQLDFSGGLPKINETIN